MPPFVRPLVAKAGNVIDGLARRWPSFMIATKNARGPPTIPGAAPGRAATRSIRHGLGARRMNPTVGTRLLVVDDDRLVVATLARELRAYGYVVEDVSSAQDAFERCECSSFDLALVDIRMPGTSGLDFARSLSERSQSCRRETTTSSTRC